MNVQVNTDNNIEGSEDLNAYIKNRLNEDFSRFNNAITRIEVHITDQNAHKSGAQDKKCLLEARVANRQPVIVSHHAETVHQAFDAASDKLMRSLNSMVGRLTSHESHKDLIEEAAVTPDEE